DVVVAVNGEGFDRHGTVDVNRDLRDLVRFFENPKQIEHLLRSTNRKGGNQNDPAPGRGPFYDFGKTFRNIDPFVQTIPVGGFQDQRIGRFDVVRTLRDELVGTSDIAGKNVQGAIAVQVHHGRTQDVAGAAKRERQPGPEFKRLIKVHC